MSNEQPRDDDQADEPTVAEYQRVDPSTLPSHPLGQQAAVEGMAAAKGWTARELTRHVRGVEGGPSAVDRIVGELNRRGVPADSVMGRFTAQMYALFEEFEQERRAEIIAAGGDPDENDAEALSRDNLISIARAHRTAMRADVDEQAYDDLIEEIAETFTLSDVRIMRGAWTAITEAMPRIAYVARQNGKSPDEIAQATGYTSSRISQFIRQEKQRAAAVPLTRYTWRIDTLDADDGRYAWTSRETGEDEATPADLAQLAERLLAETGARDQRARIFLWEGDEGTDADAVHTAERDAQ